jgi:cell division protein FtsB
MKKSRRRSSKKGRWVIILLIIAIPFFYFSRRFYKYINAKLEERRLKQEILVLEAEIEVLQSRINNYKRGTMLEAKARDNLGMIKKGEKVYLIPKK